MLINGNLAKLRRIPIRRAAAWCIGTAMLGAQMVAQAGAQQFPSDDVTIVVPFNAGGPTDLLARVIGEGLSKTWGTPVVIDNRPGATGAIGAAHAANAEADGHTLLLGSNAVNGTNELMRPNSIPYKTDDAFQPIALLAKTPLVLLVRESLGVKTLEEFIAHAKENPGKLNYSTTGIGGTSHFATELLNITAGIDTVHIPFTGQGPATQALIAGDVDFNLGGATTISEGQIPLAVMWNERLPQLPDVPTMAEQGIQGTDYYAWFGLFAPKATPEEIVEKLETDTLAVASDPAMQKRLAEIGFQPTVEGREGLEREIRENFDKARKVLAETPALVEN